MTSALRLAPRLTVADQP